MIDIATGRTFFDRLSARPVLVLLVMLFASFACRAVTFAVPAEYDPDDGLNMLLGHEILAGRLPYVQQFDHRQPLLYANFAVGEAIFGPNKFGGRILATIHVAVAALALTQAMTILGAASIAAFATGLFYVTASLGAGGTVSSSEFFFGSWVALGFWAAMAVARARRSPTKLALGAAGVGLLFGLATASKLHAACDAFGIGLITLWRLWRNDEREPIGPKVKRILIASIAIAAGGASVWLAIASLYAASGHLHEFAFSNFVFNREYRARGHFSLVENVKQTVRLASSMTLVVLVAVAAAVAGQLSAERRAVFWRFDHGPALALVWLGCASVAILANALVLTHYVLQLAPACSVLAGLGLSVLVQAPRITKPAALFVAAATAVGLAVFGVRVVKVVQQVRAAPEAAPLIGQYLREHTSANEAIFSYDDGPAYYVYARRRVPTRFSFPYWYGNDGYRSILGIEPTTFIRTVMNDQKPAYVITFDDPTRSRCDEPCRLEMDRALAESYTLETTLRGRRLYRRLAVAGG